MIERILSKCVEEGDCLLWMGRLHNGVPRARIDGGDKSIRRALWQAQKGPVKPGWYVTCNCGDRRCLNLDHARLMTARMVAIKAGKSGAFSKPQRRAAIAATQRRMSKITPEMVIEIRAAKSGAEAARALGISKSTANAIRNGSRWGEVRGASVFGWRP